MHRLVSLFALTGILAALPTSAQQMVLVNAPAPATAAVSSAAPADPFAVLPDPPQPKADKSGLKWGDWTLIGVATTFRVLDYTTTEKAMSHPNVYHEAILPPALVDSKAGFAAFQASTVAVNVYAYHELVRHHMRSIAVISQYLYDAVLISQVAKNYQLLGKLPPS